MRKSLLTLTLTIILCMGSSLGTTILAQTQEPSTTESAQGVSHVQVKRAWLKARVLGGVPKWKLPDVDVMLLRQRVMTASIEFESGRGVVFYEARLYGRFIAPPDIIDTDTGLKTHKYFIVVCLRENEIKPLLHHILVHEFLHYIWMQRVQTDMEFSKSRVGDDWNGLGERWVREVYPTDALKDHEL
jgi:hypothetical protein